MILVFDFIIYKKYFLFTLIRGFAKKTLMKTARKAGFKQKSSSKRHKYVLPNISNSSINKSNKYMTTPGRMTLPPFNNLDDTSGMLNHKQFFFFQYCVYKE